MEVHRFASQLGVGCALLALAVIAPTSAQARIHSLTGNARFQIGNGFPFPVGSTPAPDGMVQAVPGATVRQHPDPAGVASRIVLGAGQLTAAGTPNLIPLAALNPNAFQLYTSLALQLPAATASFAPFGRPGAATVTFCPGNTVTPVGNPACNPAGAVPGMLRYTRTANQFGGAARASLAGGANAALRVVSPAPCAYAGGANPNCQVLIVPQTPPPLVAIGGSFGSTATGHGPPNSGVFFATVTANGRVVGITPGLGTGLPWSISSRGGPWTTGMLTVSNPAATPPQVFVFSGSDGRGPGGTGSISLVSGAITQSSISGPDAARGWLNLVIGPQISKTPAVPVRALFSLLTLMALSGAWALRRRRGRAG